MPTGSNQERRAAVRYGTYTNADRVELAVRITAADFNGESWDGSPFSVLPGWLHDAIQLGAVTPHTRGHTDYAEWDVVLGSGKGVISAGPGDWIIRRANGDLSVVPEQDAFILINLRPPPSGDAERAVKMPSE